MPLKSKIQHPIIFLLLREVLTAARRNGAGSETPKEPSRQPAQPWLVGLPFGEWRPLPGRWECSQQDPKSPDFWRGSLALTERPGRLPALAFILPTCGFASNQNWRLWNLENPLVPWRYSLCQAIIIKCWGRHLGNIYGMRWLSR